MGTGDKHAHTHCTHQGTPAGTLPPAGTGGRAILARAGGVPAAAASGGAAAAGRAGVCVGGAGVEGVAQGSFCGKVDAGV